MTKRVHLIGCLLLVIAMIGIGFGGHLAYAVPVGNNGNHFGQIQNGTTLIRIAKAFNRPKMVPLRMGPPSPSLPPWPFLVPRWLGLESGEQCLEKFESLLSIKKEPRTRAGSEPALCF